VTLETDLDRFFGGLDTRLQGAAEYRRHAARLIGSEFNVFRYITGELLLSDILADLLDPAGSHGQGSSFLLLFLELLERRRGAKASTVVARGFRRGLDSNSPIRVRREDPSSGGRLIDIVLNQRGFGLGIENKPGLVHQKDQLSHYADELQQRFRNGWALIYLSGDGVKPPAISLSCERRGQLLASGNYLEMNYAGDLAAWLDTCIHACEADKVRWFLRDFRDYAATNFKNQETQDEGRDA
jgi:hypothetical protein